MLEVITCLIGFLGAWGLSLGVYSRNKDFFVFTDVFSVMWGLSILLNLTLLDGAMAVQPETLMVLFGAWWLFLLGAFLTLRKWHSYEVGKTMQRAKSFRLLYFLIGMHMVAVGTLAAGMGLDWQDIINSLASARSRQISFAGYPWFLQPFLTGYELYIPLAVIMLKKEWINKKQLLGIVSLAFMTSIILFTRAPLFKATMITLISVNVVFPGRQKEMAALGAMMAVGGATAFVLMQQVLVKSSSTWESLSYEISGYIGGPMRAYEEILTGRYPESPYGGYSFDWLNYFLKKIGMIDEYTSLIREYVYHPIVTNVYTFLDCFTLDFGLFGAMMGALLLGVFCALIYNALLAKGNYFFICIYSAVAYNLLMAIANNEFIRFAFVWHVFIVAMFEIYLSYRIVFRGGGTS